MASIAWISRSPIVFENSDGRFDDCLDGGAGAGIFLVAVVMFSHLTQEGNRPRRDRAGGVGLVRGTRRTNLLYPRPGPRTRDPGARSNRVMATNACYLELPGRTQHRQAVVEPGSPGKFDSGLPHSECMVLPEAASVSRIEIDNPIGHPAGVTCQGNDLFAIRRAPIAPRGALQDGPELLVSAGGGVEGPHRLPDNQGGRRLLRAHRGEPRESESRTEQAEEQESRMGQPAPQQGPCSLQPPRH